MVPCPSRATASRRRCASRSATGSGSPVIAISTSRTGKPSSASRRQPPTSHPAPPVSSNTSASVCNSAHQFIASSITGPLLLSQAASWRAASQAPARRRQAQADIAPGHTELLRFLPPAHQNDGAGVLALALELSRQANNPSQADRLERNTRSSHSNQRVWVARG